MPPEQEPKLEPRGLIGEVTENLGAVFRHMLPGVLIIGAARIAYPTWFDGLKLLDAKPELAWPMVFVGATVAIAVGM